MVGKGEGLNLLNRNGNLDLRNILINYGNDNEVNPLMELTVDSFFYDSESFLNKFRNWDKHIFLNLNVQSLMSKHEKLQDLIVS